jgi:hypothetical protein
LVVERGGHGRFGYGARTIASIVQQIPRSGRATRTGGKSKDLRDAIMSVVRSRADEPILAIVAVIDARQNELATLRDDIREILEQARSEAPEVPVAIGLAVQEIEIWMLADPDSRKAAFGEEIARAFRTVDLESEDDPKSKWLSLAGRAPLPDGKPNELHEDDQRRAAWESIRSDVVSRVCPIGFARFLEDVGGILNILY